jgi:uncharacterized protein
MMSSRRTLQWIFVTTVAISCRALPSTDATLPKPTHRVTDRAGILSVDEIDTLTNDLQELERAGLARAVIYIDSALPPGEGLEELTLRSTNAWGVGRKGIDDGLAIFVFVKDRKIRIEIGRGLESAISNENAKSIIDEQMAPAFRRGNYAEGLISAIREIRELLRHRPPHSS